MKSPTRPLHRNKIIAVTTVVLIMVVGYIFIQSKASGFFVSISPTSASLAGNAQLQTESDGSKSIQFNAPATTPPPTPPPTAPPPSGNTSCPLPKYPTPACTGVPVGTVFSKIVDGGEYNITTAGTVIDGWHIKGILNIKTSNVTIKNTLIDGTVYNWFEGDNSFTITDSTIGPESGCIVQPGIVGKNYLAQRVEIRNHDDGFRMFDPGNATVRDSYAKLCYAPPSVSPPDGSHSDGIQPVCESACANFTLDHTTIDSRDVAATFMINFVDEQASGLVATDNLLMGGGFVIVTEWHSGPKFLLQNNRVVQGSWAFGPASGEGTCSQQTWTGNSIVNIDSAYNVTSTVGGLSCPD